MIYEELVTFTVAILAKEKGFLAQSTHEKGYRIDDGLLYYRTGLDGDSLINFETGKQEWDFNHEVPLIDAPTQSLLQRWLREKHNIHITIDNYYRNTKGYKPEYCVYINGSQHGYQGNSDGGVYLFRTYELALEEALLIALKLIK